MTSSSKGLRRKNPMVCVVRSAHAVHRPVPADETEREHPERDDPPEDAHARLPALECGVHRCPADALRPPRACGGAPLMPQPPGFV